MQGGKTPLHWASYSNHTEVARALLEAKADLNSENNVNSNLCAVVIVCVQYNNTPLHYAADNDCLEVARALLDAKADVNHVDKVGSTPCML